MMTVEEKQEQSERLARAVWSILKAKQTHIVSEALAQVVGLHIACQQPEQRRGVRDGIVEMIDKFALEAAAVMVGRPP